MVTPFCDSCHSSEINSEVTQVNSSADLPMQDTHDESVILVNDIIVPGISETSVGSVVHE